jgi:hypothetical protein
VCVLCAAVCCRGRAPQPLASQRGRRARRRAPFLARHPSVCVSVPLRGARPRARPAVVCAPPATHTVGHEKEGMQNSKQSKKRRASVRARAPGGRDWRGGARGGAGAGERAESLASPLFSLVCVCVCVKRRAPAPRRPPAALSSASRRPVPTECVGGSREEFCVSPNKMAHGGGGKRGRLRRSARPALIFLFFPWLATPARTRSSSPRPSHPVRSTPHAQATYLTTRLRVGRGSPPRNGGLGAAARMSRGACPARVCAPPTHPHPSARARPTLTPAHFPILHSHLAECQACFHPHTPALTPMPAMRCVFGCGRQQRKKKNMSCMAVLN